MQAEKRSLAKAAEELQTEETRIIEAYRLGVLSPLQLGNELHGLEFTTAEPQLFLRTLLMRVVFEGKLARIEGVIPNEYVEQAVGHTADGNCSSAVGLRNPVIRFNLATEVTKDTSVAAAARGRTSF